MNPNITLPTELIEHIVNLAVEDVPLHNPREPRHNSDRTTLLRNLSLVSKVFRLPSQKALLRHIRLRLEFDVDFLELIREGLGRNMKIEHLEVSDAHTCKSDEDWQKLEDVLEGVASIERLTIENNGSLGMEELEEKLPVNLFSAPSLKNLQYLSLMGLTFPEPDPILPSTIQKIQWVVNLSSSLKTLFQLLNSSTAIIIKLHFEIMLEPFPIYSMFQPGAIQYFQSHGHNLKILKFSCFNDQFLISLFPYLTSIDTLVIYLNGRESRTYPTDPLHYLPPSSKLKVLEFGPICLLRDDLEYTLNLWFTKLFEIPTLNHLTRLHLKLRDDSLGMLYHRDSSTSHYINYILTNEKKEIMDESIEFCLDSRGIVLSFIEGEEWVFV